MLQSYQNLHYTQVQTEGLYYFKTPNYWDQRYWGGGAMRPPRTSADSSFTQTNWNSRFSYQITTWVRQTHWLAPALTLCPKHPPKPLPLKAPHQRSLGAEIEFQTPTYQERVKARTKNLLPITSVTSIWRPVLAWTTTTHILWSRVKIRPQFRTTVWSSTQSLNKLRRYTMPSTQRLNSFLLTERSSPRSTRLI